MALTPSLNVLTLVKRTLDQVKARASARALGTPGRFPLPPDSLHIRKGPGQESHFHLDGRRVFQLQDPSQVGHHGVQPGGGGFLQEGEGRAEP